MQPKVDVSNQGPKYWDIWMETYWTHEEWEDAKLLGTVEAASFEEACKKHFRENPSNDFNEDNLTFWGCQLFDNEQDAKRKWEQANG